MIVQHTPPHPPHPPNPSHPPHPSAHPHPYPHPHHHAHSHLHPVKTNPNKIPLLIAVGAIVLGFSAYFAIRNNSAKTLTPKTTTEVAHDNQGKPVATAETSDAIVDDYNKLVKSPAERNPKDAQANMTAIGEFLAKYADRKPESELVQQAIKLRGQYTQQVLMANSYSNLRQDVLALLLRGEYAKAAALVEAWRDKGGESYRVAGNEELESIRKIEKQDSEAAFARIDALAAAQERKKAVDECDAVIAHYSADYVTRAKATKSAIRSAAHDAEAAAERERAAADLEEKTARESREKAVYDGLVMKLRDPLAKMDIEAGLQLIESYKPQLSGSSKNAGYVSLAEDVAVVDVLKNRMAEAAHKGLLKELEISVLGGSYHIVDGSAVGPVLSIQSGSATIRWMDLPPSDLAAIAQLITDPASARDYCQLGTYLYQTGAYDRAEAALVKAAGLGMCVDLVLARVRDMRKKLDAEVDAKGTNVTGARWDSPETNGQLHSQRPDVETTLHDAGWWISKGFWTVTPRGTLYAEWQTPDLPLMSLKRELKRFKRLTVEMRAVGAAIGFSFGKGMRFMTTPTERWQKLELRVGAGDTIKFLVDDAPVSSLEDPKREVTSDQLPDDILIRCVGRRCEVRNFQIDASDVGAVELPWPLFKDVFEHGEQTADNANALKRQGWKIKEGRWTAAPNGGYLADAQNEPAVLQRGRPVAFRRLSVDVRGEGVAAGFDFGIGNRYLIKPTEKWQTLALDVVIGDRLQLTVNGSKSPSLLDVQDLQISSLPPLLNLRAQGGPAQFRDFRIDGRPLASSGNDEENDALLPVQQDPKETKRISALGWDISSGVWKLEGDGTLSGARVEGNDLVAVKRALSEFQEISVEIRGEGELGGFSFGLGKRWSVMPIDQWEKLQLRIIENGRLQFLVNGEPRSSIEDTRGIGIEQLGNTLYLRGICVKVQFRNFQITTKKGK